MTKTILYLHGFASSSNSNKAKILSSYISKISSNSKLMIPNLDNNFKKAVSQIELLIKNSDQPISFIGSSLGGYFAAYFASYFDVSFYSYAWRHHKKKISSIFVLGVALGLSWRQEDAQSAPRWLQRSIFPNFGTILGSMLEGCLKIFVSF